MSITLILLAAGLVLANGSFYVKDCAEQTHKNDCINGCVCWWCSDTGSCQAMEKNMTCNDIVINTDPLGCTNDKIITVFAVTLSVTFAVTCIVFGGLLLLTTCCGKKRYY